MGSEIPLFFKRRFNKDIFENALVRNMEYWIDASKRNFREYELNVLNDTIYGYFSSLYDINVYQVLELDEVYKFESYVSKKYEKVLREYWNENR